MALTLGRPAWRDEPVSGPRCEKGYGIHPSKHSEVSVFGLRSILREQGALERLTTNYGFPERCAQKSCRKHDNGPHQRQRAMNGDSNQPKRQEHEPHERVKN